ncbi:FIT family protein scs3 [Ceratocystis platani]|uniref:FIT family protein scs3 n=1 Tax=Ceratocystis fimbriata f. sp. platani TaxID=88771 RepID=A0A0F8CPJ4_CERFI|nr:FIT family protein scs3 [Ceratocystis platani]
MDSTDCSAARARSRGHTSSPSSLAQIQPSGTATTTTKTPVPHRLASMTPYIPTQRELAVYAIFPALLLFGGAYSILSPTVSASTYDPVTQGHVQDPELLPSYFASKHNVFNRYFVKVGWAWVTAAIGSFALLNPALGPTTSDTSLMAAKDSAAESAVYRRARVLVRYAAVTLAWAATTQWFFGPPIFDRSFRWSGGMCYPAEAFGPAGTLLAAEALQKAGADAEALNILAYTATTCKRVGGRWYGGHDISGHVFLLVLGSGRGRVRGVGFTGVFILGVVALKLWMLLMTAIFFHTWFEKLTGLLAATASLYLVYIVPRLIPTARAVLGVPGLD